MTTNQQEIKIIQFNVGAGDHAIIEFPENKIGIIDLNYNGKLGQNRPPALDYISYKKIKEIEFVCISHFDNDHIKGFSNLLEFCQNKNITIKQLWLSHSFNNIKFFDLIKSKLNYNKDSDSKYIAKIKNYKNFLEILEKNELIIRNLIDINIGFLKLKFENLVIDLQTLGPLPRHIEIFLKQEQSLLGSILLNEPSAYETNPNRNLISSILKFRSDKLSLLFGGDALIENWDDVRKEIKNRNIEDEISFEADWVKVSHHGSKGSSSVELWKEKIGTKDYVYAYISAGKQYNHPSDETINHIVEATSQANGIDYIFTTNICDDCRKKHTNYNKFSDKSFDDWKKEMIVKVQEDKVLMQIISENKSKDTNSENKMQGIYANLFEFNFVTNAKTHHTWIPSESLSFELCSREEFCPIRNQLFSK